MGIADEDYQQFDQTSSTDVNTEKSTKSSVATTPRDEIMTPHSSSSPIIDNSLTWLPETVTVLRNEYTQSVVYLIGTAHFSKQSQDDVGVVIQNVKPNICIVELCRNRSAILSMDEKTIENEAKNMSLDKMKSVINNDGIVQGIMYLLFLNMSAQLTKKLGMAPGGEFRRALSEVKKLGNCNITFGDRPIDITIKRALGCLSWWQTIKLFSTLVFKDCDISEEDVEKCKQKDLLEQMLSDLSKEYPNLGKVFVDERDIFLTFALQDASQIEKIHLPETADNLFTREPIKIVAVVGMGHVPGIVKLWGKVTKEDVDEVMIIPAPSKTGKVIKVVLKITFYGVIIWGVSKVVHKVFPSASNSVVKPLINSIKTLPKLVAK